MRPSKRGPQARVWSALGALMFLAAVLVWALHLPTQTWDWQPQLVTSEPWRAWTGALVHWSQQHLLANLAACAVVTLFGWGARVPPRCALAWLLAWPLTQLALLSQHDLPHFGGLSGILHAGVTVVLVELLWRGGRDRLIGACVTLGLLIKLWQEQPLGTALRHLAEWDIPVVPFSHLSGAVAGAICALILLGIARSLEGHKALYKAKGV
ncbi:rhombosortase [Paucibacter sp. Y2R2-4]|uniref:rhombosortase n=1 Tax=Paucibacter sp. Y2R2-4 TaxID=2893553 RepID=UPI0021E4D1DB|nr:rhombosortase [Paucibacter sp. Y2R2-4]MCV2351286.1 rhombosortase [Paucibacter sp. Y2R2-4]